MPPPTERVIQFEPDSILAAEGPHSGFKEGGSPFQDSANMSTMSCYRCGQHRPRALGTFTSLLNQRMFLCQECTPKVIKPRV